MHLGLIVGVVISNKPPQAIMSFNRASFLLVRYNKCYSNNIITYRVTYQLFLTPFV